MRRDSFSSSKNFGSSEPNRRVGCNLFNLAVLSVKRGGRRRQGNDLPLLISGNDYPPSAEEEVLYEIRTERADVALRPGHAIVSIQLDKIERGPY